MAKPGIGGKRSSKMLPRKSKATISNSKIDGYILDRNNKNGKAGFFVDVLGYNSRKDFRSDVLEGLKKNHAVLERTTEDKARFYVVEMTIGKTKKAKVKTVWIQNSTKDDPQFVTAYPAKEKNKK